MRREAWYQAVSYFSVAIAAIVFAFLIALHFVPKSHSQEPAPPSAAAPSTAGNPAPPPSDPKPAPESAKAVLEEVNGFLEPFIYDAKGRRDPFQPFVEIRTSSEQPVLLTPLQRWELGEYKLVGIMWDIRFPKAMFLDPENQVHVVGRDESIGKKNGYIAVIREGEVVVVESSRGKDGTMAFKPTVLRIDR